MKGLIALLMHLMISSGAEYRLVSHSKGVITTASESLREIGEPHELGPVNNRHVIILDAGSAGTRINLYEIQYAGNTMLSLVDEIYVRAKPGISSFAANPEQVIGSIEPLLKLAKERVPDWQHASTPIALKATAGLRLLPGHEADRLLAVIRGWLQRQPFLMLPDSVSVIDGVEEGVNGWVTLNFLSHTLGKAESLSVIELGGASVQLVFDAKEGELPEYYYPLDFNGHQHVLYQHSYLGFGLGEMRKAVKRHCIQSGIPFTFYPPGFNLQFEGGVLIGSPGSFAECYELAKSIFPKDTPCSQPPCTFAGVHQPELPSHSLLIGTCYFYSRLSTLHLPSPFTLPDLKRECEALCAAQPEDATVYGVLVNMDADWALDCTLIYALLAHGLGISDEQPIMVLDDVSGYKLGWTLGAALQLLK